MQKNYPKEAFMNISTTTNFNSHQKVIAFSLASGAKEVLSSNTAAYSSEGGIICYLLG